MGDKSFSNDMNYHPLSPKVTNHQPCWWFDVGPTGPMLRFRLKAVWQTILIVTGGRINAALCYFPVFPSIRSLSYCSAIYFLIVSSLTLPTVSQ